MKNSNAKKTAAIAEGLAIGVGIGLGAGLAISNMKGVSSEIQKKALVFLTALGTVIGLLKGIHDANLVEEDARELPLVDVAGCAAVPIYNCVSSGFRPLNCNLAGQTSGCFDDHSHEVGQVV